MRVFSINIYLETLTISRLHSLHLRIVAGSILSLGRAFSLQLEPSPMRKRIYNDAPKVLKVVGFLWVLQFSSTRKVDRYIFVLGNMRTQ